MSEKESRVKNLRAKLAEWQKEKQMVQSKKGKGQKQPSPQVFDFVKTVIQSLDQGSPAEEKFCHVISNYRTFLAHGSSSTELPEELRQILESFTASEKDSQRVLSDSGSAQKSHTQTADSDQQPSSMSHREDSKNENLKDDKSLPQPVKSKSPSMARHESPDIAKLKEENKNLNEEKEAVRRCLKEEKEEHQKKKQKLEECERTINELNENIGVLKQRCEKMQEDQSGLSQLVKSKDKELIRLEQNINEYVEKLNDTVQERDYFKGQIKEMDREIKEKEEEIDYHIKAKEQLEKLKKRELRGLEEMLSHEVKKRDEVIKQLVAERDDLKDRFSKVAGAKLTDHNADIADLSDPNRAMKLSERFGQLYDDEWTNAFEALSDTDKGICLPQKEAVVILLRLLQECLSFCEKIQESHTEVLRNVFLHPVQNTSITTGGKMPNIQALRDRPRVGSKEERSLRELRRQIAVQPGVVEEVKQAFVAFARSLEKEQKGFNKIHIEACIPYIQKCAELCWMIVLPDPPLYMKFDLKQGDQFDTSVYTVYSATGEKYDFLVWPPLFNGEKGGLLAKGVAEPIKKVKKAK